MNKILKKALYESIMKNVAKQVKHTLNESSAIDFQYCIYKDDYNGQYFVWSADMVNSAPKEYPHFNVENIIYKTDNIEDAINNLAEMLNVSVNSLNSDKIGNDVDNLMQYKSVDLNEYEDQEEELWEDQGDYLYYLAADDYSGYVLIFTQDDLYNIDVETIEYATNSLRDAIKYTFEAQDWDLVKYGEVPTNSQGNMKEYWDEYFSYQYL